MQGFAQDTELSPSTPTDDRTHSRTAMNRHLVTAIDHIGSLSRCDGALMALAQGSKQAGLHAPVAYAHDFGRESDDANISGEGHG